MAWLALIFVVALICVNLGFEVFAEPENRLSPGASVGIALAISLAAWLLVFDPRSRSHPDFPDDYTECQGVVYRGGMDATC